MVKGVAVNLKSYGETIPKILDVVKFSDELKKHDKIVLKPNLLFADSEKSTKPEFTEEVLKYVMANKNPGAEVFIAEGCDGHETDEVFQKLGYTNLAEKYGIGLIDLNHAETEEVSSTGFLKFESIHYPSILKDSFVVSLPSLQLHEELEISASLDNMIGAYPSKKYQSFFSSHKNKIKKHELKYQVHDILKCKMPNFAIIDASDLGLLLVGQPLEMDKQSARAAKLNWQNVEHLRLIDESFSVSKDVDKEVSELIRED